MYFISKLKVAFALGLVIAVGACSTQSKRGGNLPSKEEVIDILSKVNDKWQAENDVLKQRPFWHSAAYHIGNLAAYEITRKKNYLDYTTTWAENNQWAGAKSTRPEEWKFSYGETDEYVLFGDWQACFQVYIDLYQMNPVEHKVARAKEVMGYQVSTDESKYWWWIDGLFMVMPVMPRMYALTQDEIYLEKLHEYYSYTISEVYDEETGLLFRDAKYTYPKHTTNAGKKDFWSRGNGWVFAALARTIDKLPASDAHYAGYVAVFTKMAETLKASQQSEGYWTRSILDPEQAPGPETSGTAFFTYGMLWGINKGILDKETYASIVEAGWKYLAETAVQEDGTLGYIQPIGEKAIPGQIIDIHSTADFGVGAFLLAATEMVKFIDKQDNK
ncbi:MAG: glycoside hydrolase family 88 protein [Bacteroidales bacterium]|nr:glycoside hydrolase family 88 protein [Bacteroidales bacterium]